MIERRHCCIMFIRLPPPHPPSKRALPRKSSSRTLLGFTAEEISNFNLGENKEPHPPSKDPPQPTGDSSAHATSKSAVSSDDNSRPRRISRKSSQKSIGDDAPAPSSARKHECHGDWITWSVRIVQLIIAPYGGGNG